MIDGLRLTFSGEELRSLLEEGVRRHEARARRWTRETQRTADDASEDAPLLPDDMCENEAERHTWRADVLAFIREHVDAAEAYRLGVADLEFGELLPEKPGSVEHDEYQERTRLAFNLERLVKSVSGLPDLLAMRHSRAESHRDESGTMQETVVEDTEEFRATRLTIEGAPEIVRIERK